MSLRRNIDENGSRQSTIWPIGIAKIDDLDLVADGLRIILGNFAHYLRLAEWRELSGDKADLNPWGFIREGNLLSFHFDAMTAPARNRARRGVDGFQLRMRSAIVDGRFGADGS